MSLHILWNQHRVGDAGFRNVQHRQFFYSRAGSPWTFVPVTRDARTPDDTIGAIDEIFEEFGDVTIKVVFVDHNSHVMHFYPSEREDVHTAAEQFRTLVKEVA